MQKFKRINLNSEEILVLCPYNDKLKNSVKKDNIVNSNNENDSFYGLPWGEGNVDYLDTDKFVLVAINKNDNYHTHKMKNDKIDKCEFKKGRIVFSGKINQAIKIIKETSPENSFVVFSRQNGKDNAIQNSGSCSLQIAGNNAKQTTGDGSKQKAKNNSRQTAGDKSIQIAGNGSYQISGNESHQIAGEKSFQTSGKKSFQFAKNDSTQTAGVGTTQTTRWFENEWKTKTRIVEESMANQPYNVKDGIWTKIDTEKIISI